MTFEFLCSYLAELTLMDYGMLNYLPSTIAAACVTVALFMLGKPHWSATLSHYSGYLPRDLRHCAQVRAGGEGIGGRLLWGEQLRAICLERLSASRLHKDAVSCLLRGARRPASSRSPHPFPPAPLPPPQAVHALFMQAKTSNLPASRDKYASPKYASVSQLGCADALPDWMFQ